MQIENNLTDPDAYDTSFREAVMELLQQSHRSTRIFDTSNFRIISFGASLGAGAMIRCLFRRAGPGVKTA